MAPSVSHHTTDYLNQTIRYPHATRNATSLSTARSPAYTLLTASHPAIVSSWEALTMDPSLYGRSSICASVVAVVRHLYVPQHPQTASPLDDIHNSFEGRCQAPAREGGHFYGMLTVHLTGRYNRGVGLDRPPIVSRELTCNIYPHH